MSLKHSQRCECVCVWGGPLRGGINGDQWDLGRVPGETERLTHGTGHRCARKGQVKLLQSSVETWFSGCGGGTSTPALLRRLLRVSS